MNEKKQANMVLTNETAEVLEVFQLNEVKGGNDGDPIVLYDQP